ncbi:ABC-type maltose/maltodextrin transporter permease MALC [Mycoplasmoides gallisepticum str. F]|uniref:ABC transporter permease subunit n=1 Tax=Mycoplasmoides gallisepticum TaxID=2096 RepID=UPI0001C398B3|nr:ABC transporter permease subunit [Mycoplasmoides gallisepticum]ADC31414.1 ABC-type maltose/maltodextrin transporter permease MALC [Mycoplasmoides gallisepticum str. F]
MEKLKLYNWYGESFELKLPEASTNLKAYKKQVENLFLRMKDEIKTRHNIEKNLFLKARQKITDNLQRELESHKVAYKNKLKVFKDSIQKLAHVTSLQALLNYELRKLELKKKQNKKYVDDFINSLRNSADSLEDKLRNIEDLKNKTNRSEAYIAKIFCLYSTILTYIKRTNDRQFDLTKINDSLNSYEKTLLATLDDPAKYLSELYNKIEARRLRLFNTRQELQRKHDQTLSLIKKLYEVERKNIILNASQRLIEIENEYNHKYEQATLEANQFKQNALAKVQAHKKQILEVENANKIKVQKIYDQAHLARKQIKQNKRAAYLDQQLSLKIKNYKDFYHLINNYSGYSNQIPQINWDLLEQKDQKLALLELKKLTDDFINQTNNDFALLAHKSFFGIKNHYELKKEAKALYKSQYNQLLAKTYKKYSYESDYKEEISSAYKQYTIDHSITRNKFLEEKLVAKYELLKINKRSEQEEEKRNFNQQLNQIKTKIKDQLIELKNKLRTKEISKKAFKNKLIELKVSKKEAIYELKLDSKILKNKETLKSLFIREFAEQKINKKIFESKTNEAQKSIPIETSINVKRFSWLLAFFIPGASELLFFKQYVKGTIMFLYTIVNYALFLPFILGKYADKMKGILGVIDLGANDRGDARYYLFGGVLSVILISAMLIYFIISAISANRVAKALYYGNRPSQWSHSKRWLSSSGFPWMISIFGWVLMLFVVVSPVITSVFLSFTNIGFNHIPPNREVNWVGLEQWGRWWTLRNSNLLGSISNVLLWTFIWTFASTLIPIGLGILVAILTNNPRIKGRKIFRIIFILPWAIPAFVTVGFIRTMFAAGETGYINTILNYIFQMQPKSWLNDITWTRVLLIIVQTWIGYAWIFMLVTSNLQSIPRDIYEAGSVDGAKPRHLFWYLTLPQLLLSISPLLIALFVGSFNNFTTIFIFNNGGPAYAKPTPFGEGSTDIIVSWVFKLSNPQGVQFPGNQAFGAALATLASMFSIGIALRGFIKSMNRRD